MIGHCINLLNQRKRFLETKNELSKIGIDLVRFEVDIQLTPGIKKLNINLFERFLDKIKDNLV
jgi:hypothetical protein